MPWITVVTGQEPQGELKEVYWKIRQQRKGDRINQERHSAKVGPPITPPALRSLAEARGVAMPDHHWGVR